MSKFRYKVPEDVILEAGNDYTLRYYEAQALYERSDIVNYTISKYFLGTLDNVNLDEFHKNKNKWSAIRFGDKNKQGLTTMIPTKDISSVNYFIHKNTPYIMCMLLSVASAM